MGILNIFILSMFVHIYREYIIQGRTGQVYHVTTTHCNIFTLVRPVQPYPRALIWQVQKPLSTGQTGITTLVQWSDRYNHPHALVRQVQLPSCTGQTGTTTLVHWSDQYNYPRALVRWVQAPLCTGQTGTTTFVHWSDGSPLCLGQTSSSTTTLVHWSDRYNYPWALVRWVQPPLCTDLPFLCL